MNPIPAKKPFIGVALCFFIISILFTVGCAGTKIRAEKRTENDSGYHEAENKHKKEGPPAHAPAHGYRAKHKYRYYPDCSVYHDAERGLYFYVKWGNWEVSASLPDNLKMELGEYVSLELDTDRPYLYYDDHLKQYPPGEKDKSKNKKNKKHKWG